MKSSRRLASAIMNIATFAALGATSAPAFGATAVKIPQSMLPESSVATRALSAPQTWEASVSNWAPADVRLSGGESDSRLPTFSAARYFPLLQHGTNQLNGKVGAGITRLSRTTLLDSGPASQSILLLNARAGLEYRLESGAYPSPYIVAALRPTAGLIPRSQIAEGSSSAGFAGELGFGLIASLKWLGAPGLEISAGYLMTRGSIESADLNTNAMEFGLRVGPTFW